MLVLSPKFGSVGEVQGSTRKDGEHTSQGANQPSGFRFIPSCADRFFVHPKNPWDVGFGVSSCHLF